MPKKTRWLEPNLMSEEDKAFIARLAKERHMTVDDVIKQLEIEQAKQSNPQPPPHKSLLKTSGQFAEPPMPAAIKKTPLWQEFEPRPLDPEPPSITLGYDVENVRIADDPPQVQSQPDPRLIDVARIWQSLSERDREELLLIARVKLHLSKTERS